MKHLVVAGLVGVCLASPALAQLPVQEVGPMTLAHTTTALQQTLNTVEAIFQSAQWVLEMSSYDSHGTEFGGTVDAMILDTQQILWDINALDRVIRQLFALDSAPTSTKALQERLYAIRRYRFEQQSAARQVQTLPQLVLKTLADLRVLWSRILSILGNKQGQQQIQALLVEINKTEAVSQVSLAAYQQAMLTDAAEQTLIDESLEKINTELFATMPRRR